MVRDMVTVLTRNDHNNHYVWESLYNQESLNLKAVMTWHMVVKGGGGGRGTGFTATCSRGV